MGRIHDLMPRLVEHHTNTVEYYQRQLDRARIDLARIGLMASGQLMLFELPLYKEGTAEHHLIDSGGAHAEEENT